MVRFTLSIMLWHYEFKLDNENMIKNKTKINIHGIRDAVIMAKKTLRNKLPTRNWYIIYFIRLPQVILNDKVILIRGKNGINVLSTTILEYS